MELADAVKTALSAGGLSQGEFAEVLGMTKQAVGNKMTRGSWTGSELIKLAKCTKGKLLIEYPDGTRIVFGDQDPE